MGKQLFNATRRDCYLFDPQELVLIRDKEHPLYDPRVELPVDDALVESIMFDSQGVIKPIVITKDGEDAVVVDGRQRVKAALEANKRLKKAGAVLVKVPCVVRKGSAKHLTAASVTANEVRINDDILARAKKASNLLNMGYTEEEIAKLFGVTKQTILNYLAIDGLDKAVKKAIGEEKIPASHAMKLAKIPKKEQYQAMSEYLEQNKDKKPKIERKKTDKKNPLNVQKMRSKKECKQMIEALGENHAFAVVIKWFMGDDIDLTEYKSEHGIEYNGNTGFFVSKE